MRDIVLLSIIFGALPIIFLRPYVGVLLWAWLSYMNPHRMAWGMAYDFPVAAIVGVVTIFSLLFVKEEKRIPWTPVTATLVIFIIWMSFTTLFALVPDGAMDAWIKVIKIQMFTFVTILLLQARKRINGFIVLIVISLGFFGVKGGVFTILTGGESKVWGPPDSFLQDNNALALALVMAMPMMRYLQVIVTHQWLRFGLLLLMLLTLISVIGSYSRGALLAVLSVAIAFFVQSQKKLVIVLMLLVTLSVAWNFIPEKWFDRMETIGTYEQDASAMGRINAWWFGFNMAKDRPFVGGGFEAFNRELFLRYAPDPTVYQGAHSIYFLVLGEHGFVGLFLFLLLGIHTIRASNWVIRNAKDRPDLRWSVDLMELMRLSIISYAVGGAFLGLTYFDLYYHIVAIVVVTRCVVEKELKASLNQSTSKQPPLAIFPVDPIHPTSKPLD